MATLDRDRTALYLRMIDLAQSNGVSWAAMARSLGEVDGKTLKNKVKRLAHQYERALRRERGGV